MKSEAIHFQTLAIAPPRRIGPKRAVNLSVDDVRPWIRLAHRHQGSFGMERIIFDHELVLFIRGGGEARMGEQRFEIRPHRLFVVRPYEFNGFRTTTGPVEHFAVHFDLAPGLPAFADRIRRRQPYEVQLSHGLRLPDMMDLSPAHPVEQLLVSIVTARQSDAPIAKLEATILLSQVILLLLKSSVALATDATAHAHDRLNELRVRRAIDYIREHLAESIAPSDLAAVADVSEPHLVRLFARWTGRSPAEYVRRARIDKAKELFADLDLSIKEIAYQTGFKSQYHFSRLFHRLDGLSPTLYRDTLLGIGATRR